MAYVFPPPNFASQSQSNAGLTGPQRFSPGPHRPRAPRPTFTDGGHFHRYQRGSPNFNQRPPSQSHVQHGNVFSPRGAYFKHRGPRPQSTHQPSGGIRPLLPEYQHTFPGQSHGQQPWKGTGNGNRGPQHKFIEKKKKVKKEKILPFYCESCERGFKTQEKLNEHNDEHVKCEGKDCKFEAHWKLVKIHYQNQHGPGSKKIGRLETPEEISKWREARKRNYPTVSNMAKKKEEILRRQDSGQVLKTKTFGKMGKSNKRKQGERFQGGFNNRQNNKFISKEIVQNQGTSPKKAKLDNEKSNVDESKTHSPTCDPLSFILDDEEPSSNVTSQSKQAETHSTPSALGCLAANYGSDTDSDQNDEETKDEQKASLQKQPEVKETTVQHQKKEGWKSKRQQRKNRKRGRNQQNEKSDQQLNRQMNGRKTKQTLLEMLLAPEIRHERNVILQCVRYIRKNNFFNVGKRSTEQTSDTLNITINEQEMDKIKNTTTDTKQSTICVTDISKDSNTNRNDDVNMCRDRDDTDSSVTVNGKQIIEPIGS